MSKNLSKAIDDLWMKIELKVYGTVSGVSKFFFFFF